MRGWLEILLVGIALLAIFGPKTLQSLARNAGRGAGQARKMKDKIAADLSVDDVKKAADTLSHIPRSSGDVVRMLISSDEKKRDSAKSSTLASPVAEPPAEQQKT